MSFEAQFGGECDTCGTRITPGNLIARVGAAAYVHVDPPCRDPLPAPTAREPLCARCGLNHPGEC